MLEKVCPMAGLGIPLCPLRRTRRGGLVEGNLDVNETAAERIIGWIDIFLSFFPFNVISRREETSV